MFLLDQFTQIGELTRFEQIEIVERDLDVGSFRVTFNPEINPGQYQAALEATWLGVEVYDTETGHRWAGKVQTERRVFQGNRVPSLIEYRGVDMMDIIAARLEWPDPLDYTLFWTESNITLQLSELVNTDATFEFGASALAERQVTGINIVDPVPHIGPVKFELSSRRPLLDVWAPWFEGTTRTLRIRFNRDDATGAGEIRFEPVDRAVTEVIVTPELHHGEIEITRTAAAATHVIVMGDLTGGTPFERFTAEARAAEANWLEEHREKFINRPSADQATIDDTAADTLAANGPRLAIRASDIDIPDYGTTVLIGDLVTVSFSTDEGPYLLPISEMKLTADTNDGFRRAAAIGSSIPGPAELLSKRIAAVAGQADRIEGDL